MKTVVVTRDTCILCIQGLIFDDINAYVSAARMKHSRLPVVCTMCQDQSYTYTYMYNAAPAWVFFGMTLQISLGGTLRISFSTKHHFKRICCINKNVGFLPQSNSFTCTTNLPIWLVTTYSNLYFQVTWRWWRSCEALKASLKNHLHRTCYCMIVLLCDG